MRLLHTIHINRSQLLIMKNERSTPYIGHFIGVDINYPLEVEMYLDSRAGTTKDHLKEMAELNINCAIPITTGDTDNTLVAYYVRFAADAPINTNSDWYELKETLEAELKERMLCKYLLITKTKKKKTKVAVHSVEGVQQILDNLKLPFEFTVDEELCILHKAKKKHTSKHVYAKCKYYKTKEGQYVQFKKLPAKAK